ncbi:MAG: efflux RND transporter periplasmic adaptor subunit [Myxococcales bacterium]|nr:efflux RND transporter periplasmic adaptor subunit [Myxococcales bacterium]
MSGEAGNPTTKSRGLVSVGVPSPRARVLRVVAVASLVIGVGLAVMVALKKTKVPDASVAPPRDVARLDGKWIRFSKEFALRAGIESAVVEQASLEPTISVTGAATFDPEAVAAVGARIAGRVRKVVKYPGDAVKRGEVLAELESAELGQAQAAVLSARAHVEAATANEAREKQLAEARVSSMRDFELARATAQATRAELHAAEQKVRALGGAGGGEIGVMALTSPIDGKVVELRASRGQSVEPSHTVFKVADIRSLWIELAVFERELGHVRRGDVVEMSPQTNTQMLVRGKVAHVGDIIDLDTRSAQVRVEIDNREEKLRPGQSVIARIHTQTAPLSVVVPRDAVTTVDGKATVFLVHEETAVEPRAVIVGSRDGTRVQIKQGLEVGERVVVKGVFALKSEVFR